MRLRAGSRGIASAYPPAAHLQRSAGSVSTRPLQLDTRVALRPREAAKALGISERTLRQLLPELPTVRRGNIVLIPVDLLRKWLREESEAEKGRVEAAVEEILGAVGSEGKE